MLHLQKARLGWGATRFLWPWPCWLSSVSVGAAACLLCVGRKAWTPVFGNQPVCSCLWPQRSYVQTVTCKSLVTCLFAAACCPYRVLTCFLQIAGSAVCEPQRLQAHRKLQDASAAASAASGAASGAAAAGASSESTSAAAAAAAAATGEASFSYGLAHPLRALERVPHTANSGGQGCLRLLINCLCPFGCVLYRTSLEPLHRQGVPLLTPAFSCLQQARVTSTSPSLPRPPRCTRYQRW